MFIPPKTRNRHDDATHSGGVVHSHVVPNARSCTRAHTTWLTMRLPPRSAHAPASSAALRWNA